MTKEGELYDFFKYRNSPEDEEYIIATVFRELDENHLRPIAIGQMAVPEELKGKCLIVQPEYTAVVEEGLGPYTVIKFVKK